MERAKKILLRCWLPLYELVTDAFAFATDPEARRDSGLTNSCGNAVSLRQARQIASQSTQSWVFLVPNEDHPSTYQRSALSLANFLAEIQTQNPEPIIWHRRGEKAARTTGEALYQALHSAYEYGILPKDAMIQHISQAFTPGAPQATFDWTAPCTRVIIAPRPELAKWIPVCTAWDEKAQKVQSLRPGEALIIFQNKYRSWGFAWSPPKKLHLL